MRDHLLVDAKWSVLLDSDVGVVGDCYRAGEELAEELGGQFKLSHSDAIGVLKEVIPGCVRALNSASVGVGDGMILKMSFDALSMVVRAEVFIEHAQITKRAEAAIRKAAKSARREKEEESRAYPKRARKAGRKTDDGK